MKTETIKAFLDALKDNPTAQEIVRNTPEPESDEGHIRVYAKIAAELGFDLDEQDLAEYVEKKQQYRREQTQAAAGRIQQLPPEQLGEAAGGNDYRCQDTFENYENCWHNDACDLVYHYYKGYQCHWTNVCGNHNGSCGTEMKDKCGNDHYCY